MELQLNDNFCTLDKNDLVDIDGGISRNDALGMAGSALYVGGIIVGCVASGGLGIGLIGAGFVAWDSMH